MAIHIYSKKICDNNKDLFDYRDKVISEPLIFSDCEFETDVLFQYCNIESRIMFERCVFNKQLIFGDKKDSYHAYVSQNIECNDCTFHDKVLLDGLICKGNVFFSKCVFSYKSQDYSDYGLSISRSVIDNSLQLRNCEFNCGIDFSNSNFTHNGCVFEEVNIKSKKGVLDFSSCHVGKELTFHKCQIVIGMIRMDQLGVDESTGSVKFIGDGNAISKIELTDNLLERIKDPNTRIEFILSLPIIEEYGGYKSFSIMRENIITVRVGNGFLCFKKEEKNERVYFSVYNWGYLKVINDFFLSNGNLGCTVFFEDIEVHCTILDVQESRCGSFTIDNAVIESNVWDLRSMQISNNFNVNHTLCQFFDMGLDMDKLFKKSKFGHIQTCSTEIGHDFDFNDNYFEIAGLNGEPFYDEEGNVDLTPRSVHLDFDRMRIGGSITMENLYLSRHSHLIDTNNESEIIAHELHVNLEATTTETCFFNFTDENWCNLYIEDFKFANILINGKLPGKTELIAMIPKESSFIRPKEYDKIVKGSKQGCNIQTGMISFMRDCQDKLIKTKDGYDEANEIWRLRNQLRLFQQYKNKRLKYFLYRTWNKFTDFGLTSTTILYVVLGVFVLYLGLNILILSLYTQHDIASDKMSVIGQSLIQYIPTIDFGDEIKIINFEQGLPPEYKYLVIAARITGFILISILIASLGGLWKGRNK